MEKIKENIKQKEIMIYMGSYVRDRNEGKYNNYVTYDEDVNVTYNSYINLKSDRVHNVEKDKCAEFEKEYTIIKMPVSANNFDLYLSNYMYLRTWYLSQLETREEECVTRELTKISKLKYIKLYIACHNYELKARKIQCAKDGFIEKFCLSEEDREILQLSRKENE